MVPTYRAAAKFIEKTRDHYPDMIYTSVSFVGSTALANELLLLGQRYATGVIVTQVVPALDGHSSLVLDYKAALAKYFPGEAPDYVSLEGECYDRGIKAQWSRARRRKTGHDSGESTRSRHRAWHACELQPIRASGCAQGVGHAARRNRPLSTDGP
jgi:predicted heme/steroid binding protein